MSQNTEKKIKDLESIIPKVDGHTRKHRIMNRLYGLSNVALGGLLIYQVPYSTPLSLCFVVEGVGDLITGKHHYLSYRALNIHPQDEINQLRNS